MSTNEIKKVIMILIFLVFFYKKDFFHYEIQTFTKRILSNCVITGTTRYRVNTTVNIQNCVFSIKVNSGTGGAISIYGPYTMTISDASFFECMASQSGGAIFFNAYSASLTRVCGFRCRYFSSVYGHFAYILLELVIKLQ